MPKIVVETRIERPKVPAELLTCKPEPSRPPEGFTQADVGYLLADLVVAGADCRSKLSRVRELLTPAPGAGKESKP